MLHAVGNRCRSTLSPIVLRDPHLALITGLRILRGKKTKTSTKRSSTASTSKARPLAPSSLHSTRHSGLSTGEAVNPPASGRPPALDLPTSDPAVPFYKHYFRLGRAYVGFYKSGFKQIIENAKTGRSFPLFYPEALKEALRESTITRGQYQLFVRTRSDISRIPLFALVFLVCGEFTPLLVPFLSPIVPKTLWLPFQWEKARRQAEVRRQRCIRVKKKESNSDGESSASRSLKVRPSGIEAALGVSRYNLGIRINAWPRWWDSWLVRRVPLSYLTKRIDAKLHELLLDNFAIYRDGGVSAMVDEEVRMALDARGQDVVGKEMAEMRMVLQKEVEKSKLEWKGVMGRAND